MAGPTLSAQTQPRRSKRLHNRQHRTNRQCIAKTGDCRQINTAQRSPVGSIWLAQFLTRPTPGGLQRQRKDELESLLSAGCSCEKHMRLIMGQGSCRRSPPPRLSRPDLSGGGVMPAPRPKHQHAAAAQKPAAGPRKTHPQFTHGVLGPALVRSRLSSRPFPCTCDCSQLEPPGPTCSLSPPPPPPAAPVFLPRGDGRLSSLCAEAQQQPAARQAARRWPVLTGRKG